MHVEVSGEGPPLVLLHGWAMHGGVFAPLVARLCASRRLHVVDLPGHGGSRDSHVPLTLDACVDAIAAQVPVAPWCGWSLGGLVALHAASRMPARVPALVMLCATPRFVRSTAGETPPWRWGMSPSILADFADGLRDDYRGTLDRFLALEAFGSADVRGELHVLRAQLFARGEMAPHVLADGLSLLQAADLRGALPTLSVPSLWLGGQRDRVVDPRAMREASALAPNARYDVVAHGGHAPFLTHADVVGDAIGQFLDEAAA
ncbi:MAG TPA: pimeloyl-ACP methyl ester esterase BioH [Luteimonas sp.]|nr:pimeloyl-ACP methyl ester esterase BioH [Luteimonas sp.]